MGNIKNASKINLSNHGLTEIPSYIFECKNLKILNLSNNQITEIPKELIGLKQLRNLDLSNNKISQLYAKTFVLKNLVVLNLSNNRIKSIPKQIATLTKLTRLLLAGNLIEKLPKEIESLPNLKQLNLSNNQFTDFPDSILKLTSLTHLWFGQNKFQGIPTSEIISHLVDLKGIYCYGAVQSIDDHNKGLGLLTKQRGNAINSIKLMEYNEIPPRGGKSTNKRLPHKIFISYSHKDEKYKDEVVTTLTGLKNVLPDLEFEYWVDTKIKSGKDWLKEIEDALNNSGIAIFIVSRYFLASEFIMKTEVPTILENVEKKGVVILSLIAGQSPFKKSPLGRFQAVNEPSKPLKSLSERAGCSIY